MKIPGIFLVLLGLVLAADPYQVLGLGRDALDKEIKSAYRQLSKQYHPDKNSAPDAHDKFIEIGEAYDILSDADKKLKFDRFGDANGPQGGGQGGFDFGDMFGQFFNQGQGGQPGKRRGADTQVTVKTLLKEFFVGKDFEFDVEMDNICGKCTGSGSADGHRHQCSKCGGSGVVMVRRQIGPMVQQFQSACDQCGGKGSTIAKACADCHGKGTQRAQRHYNVYIAPGTPRFHTEVLEGEGDQNPDWIPGNMNLRFVEDPKDNWGFRRVGSNLYRTEILTSKEANAGGWTRSIKLFDDETVDIKRSAGETVIDGEVEVIKSHGMPVFNEDDFGDLFVLYRVIPIGKSDAKDEL